MIPVLCLAILVAVFYAGAYYDLKRKNRQREAENYIFTFSRRGSEFFSAYPSEEITEFLSVYHMDVTEFQRRIVEPAIVDEMLRYKKAHPAEFPEHYGNESSYSGIY